MPTYTQIKKQIAKLEDQALQARKKEVAGVIGKIKEAIQFYGLTAAELGFTPNGKAHANGKKAIVRYRNKATGETWAGRGMKPRWLQAALKAGRKLEEFRA
jgi:DNA-binding protein H-NS